MCPSSSPGSSSINIRSGGVSRSSNCPRRIDQTQAAAAEAPIRIAIGKATYRTLMGYRKVLETSTEEMTVRELSGIKIAAISGWIRPDMASVTATEL